MEENFDNQTFEKIIDEGVQSDFEPIENEDQENVLFMVCPFCTLEMRLNEVNCTLKTVMDQSSRDFVKLKHGFTTNDCYTRFGQGKRIAEYTEISGVINIADFGMIPISSNNEMVLEDHSEIAEMIEHVFGMEIGNWNTLRGLHRHIVREHGFQRQAFTQERALRWPVENAITEAGMRIFNLYKTEGVAPTPQPRRSFTKQVHILYKALKVSIFN